MSVKEQIRQFIVDEFLFGQDGSLDNNASLLEAGILDSMGVLQTLFHLEEKFGIKIEDDEVVPDNIDSINALAAFVERKQKVTA